MNRFKILAVILVMSSNIWAKPLALEDQWKYFGSAEKEQNNDSSQGINPGIAIGKLVVIRTASEFTQLKWDKSSIYLLPSTPPKISPIAGVVTLNSGSAISHVQLLARSLGIPNGSVKQEAYDEFSKLDGQEVVYVSFPNRSLIIKKTADLTKVQKDLIDQYFGISKIEPVEINYPNTKFAELISLDKISKNDSGKIAGPKGANLGTLKSLFPDRVADGFVITFGIAKKYFDKYKISEQIIKLGTLSEEQEINSQLSLIRNKIQEVTFDQNDSNAILTWSKRLIDTNGGDGLFIRSDTNVEDLAKFSGAGLNKTIPNVIDLNKVLEVIKDVWSSPWEQRAHAWRRQYIKNGDAVIPSVVVMQSVNSRKSGVFVNKNLENDSEDDMFISSNEGLGFKVVDGSETPEQWILEKVGDLSASVDDRLRLVNRVKALTMYILDSVNGGIKEVPTRSRAVLNLEEIEQLEKIALRLKTEFAGQAQVMESEFGVLENGKVVLFQARPFVESGNLETKKIIKDFLETEE